MEGSAMKRRIFKAFVFSFAVTVIASLFVFFGSAKSVRKNGFTYDVQKNSVTVVSYTGTAKKVKVPKKVNGVPVTAIGNECFWQARTITVLSLPDTITKIGESAFNECTSLKKIVLPKELKELGASAFWYCTGLETVVLDRNVQKVGKDAFRGCDKVTVFATDGTGAYSQLQKLGTVELALTYPTEINLRKSLKVTSGASKTIKLSASPSGTYYNKLNVSTSNKDVFDLSSDGSYLAGGCGKAVVTVSVKGNENVKATCRVTVKPAKPAELKQSGRTVSSATITWEKAKGATEYKLTKFDTAKKKWVSLASTEKTTYTLKQLKKGESVKLRVRSVFKQGKTTILGGIASVSVAAKNNAAVTKLRQTAKTIDTVTIKWNAPVGAEKFTVVLQDKNGKELTKAETLKPEFTFDGLESCATCTAKVRAVYTNGGKEENGKVASLTVKTLVPEKITSLKASGVTDSGATLTWNALSGASRYYIYKYSSEKNAFVSVASTEKTSFSLTALEPETTTKLRVSPAFTKSDGKLVVTEGTEISVTTEPRPIPKTKEEAVANFVKAFNNTCNQKDFSLFETTVLTETSLLPKKDEIQNILAAVDNSSKSDYNFSGGTETTKKQSLSALVPVMNGKLSISQEVADRCAVDFYGNGNGYYIELTFPATDENADFASIFATLPNWSEIEKEKGVNFSSVEYAETTVRAKVNGGRLDDIFVRVPFTAAGTSGSTVFTIGGTFESEYIFLWN